MKAYTEKLNQVDDLNRFIEVQDHITTTGKSVYEQAIQDIQNGYLSVHCWIRYLFPQLKGFGTSSVTKYFELDGREEALAYINHPILGDRLIHATKTVLDNKYSIYEILKRPLSIQKFRACMLLFSTISDNPVFKQVLNKYRW